MPYRKQLKQLRANDPALTEAEIIFPALRNSERIFKEADWSLQALCKNTEVKSLVLVQEVADEGELLTLAHGKELIAMLLANSTLTSLHFEVSGFPTELQAEFNAALFETQLRRVQKLQLGTSWLLPALAKRLKRPHHLHTLVLRVPGATSKPLLELAASLKSNATVTSLDLMDFEIPHKSMKLLLERLLSNSGLRTLKLEGLDVDSEGLKAMARALSRNTSLTSVSFVGSRGCPQLQLASVFGEVLRNNSTLEALDLGHASSSRTVKLYRTLKLEHLLEKLQCKSGVKKLIWAANDATLPIRKHALLNNLAALQELSLASCGLNFSRQERLLRAFLGLSTLTSLDLKGNKVGDPGAEVLAEVLRTRGADSALVTLNLSRAEVGDKGARHLAPMLEQSCSLTTLVMSDNPLQLPGRKALLQALRNNTSLTDFAMLGDFFLDWDGELGRCLAEAIRANATLRHLKVSLRGPSPLLPQAVSRNFTLHSLTINEKCVKLEENLEPHLVLQAQWTKKKAGIRLLVLRFMSGEVAARLTAEPSWTTWDLQEQVQEQFDKDEYPGRVVVLLPNGEKLHRFPDESTVEQILPC